MAAPSGADSESTSEDEGLYGTIQRGAITPTQDRVNLEQLLELASSLPMTDISPQALHAIAMLNNARLEEALRLGKTLEDMVFNEAELAWQWDGMQHPIIQAYNRGELPVINQRAQVVPGGRPLRSPTRSLSPEVNGQPPPNAEVNDQPPPHTEVNNQPSPTLGSDSSGNGSNTEGSLVPAEGDSDFRTLRLPLQLAMRMKDAIEKMEVRATNWNHLLEILGKHPPPTIGEAEESFHIVSELISDVWTIEAWCQYEFTVPEERIYSIIQGLPALMLRLMGLLQPEEFTEDRSFNDWGPDWKARAEAVD